MQAIAATLNNCPMKGDKNDWERCTLMEQMGNSTGRFLEWADMRRKETTQHT